MSSTASFIYFRPGGIGEPSSKEGCSQKVGFAIGS